MSVVELVDRLVVADGQVRELDNPSLGVTLEVEAEIGLYPILRQRPRGAQQDGHSDEGSNGQQPPDEYLAARASV